MNQGKRRLARLIPKSLAIVLILSTRILSAEPLGHSDAKQTAFGPSSVAIVPFVFFGRVDENLTNAFHERLVSLKTGSRIVDGASLQTQLGRGVQFRSDAPIGALLKAARAANAEVLIIGQASSYKFLEAPGVSLRVRVIGVASGKELHRDLAKETSWTLSGAKSEAGSTAARKIVKQWRSE